MFLNKTNHSLCSNKKNLQNNEGLLSFCSEVFFVYFLIASNALLKIALERIA